MRPLHYIWIFLAVAVLGFGGFMVLRAPRTEKIDLILSQPVATPPAPRETKLLFTGDIMLAREVGERIKASGDWRYPFLNIASTTSAADVTFGNLETPISDRGRKIGSIYSFRADPRTVEGLQYAGFDAVALANNHAWDYAAEAFSDTQKHLRQAGIEYAGGGADYEEAHAPKIIERNGMKIAFLAYTNLLPKFFTQPSSTPASASYADWNRVLKDIGKARSEADIVVVAYHWGEEYQTKHDAEQEKVGHATIDAGADLVIGSHPHVRQELEQYKNGWIAYSLGNFVFDQYFSPEVMRGTMLEVDLTGRKITAVKEIPVFIPKGAEPELATSSVAAYP